MKALIIHEDGRMAVDETMPFEPHDQLEWLWGQVGGYITPIRAADLPSVTVMCDEEGMLRGRLRNHAAELFVGRAPVVGTVVVLGDQRGTTWADVPNEAVSRAGAIISLHPQKFRWDPKRVTAEVDRTALPDTHYGPPEEV